MNIKKYITIVLLIFGVILFTQINSNYTSYSAYSFTSGSPGGKTNSPGDGSTCNSCHGGPLNSGSGMPSISSAALSGGYVPGQTYTITATITNASINKFGFEVTAEKDVDNSKVGTFTITDATRTKLINGNKAVCHKNTGTTGSGSASWTFDWTAPPAGSGSVTFYGAFNASNSNSSSSGDLIYTTSMQVSESITTSLNESLRTKKNLIYPNPTNGILKINTQNKLTSISIYDYKGKLILKKTNTSTVSVEGVPNGIYIADIVIGNESFIEKIIKH